MLKQWPVFCHPSSHYGSEYGFNYHHHTLHVGFHCHDRPVYSFRFEFQNEAVIFITKMRLLHLSLIKPTFVICSYYLNCSSWGFRQFESHLKNWNKFYNPQFFRPKQKIYEIYFYIAYPFKALFWRFFIYIDILLFSLFTHPKVTRLRLITWYRVIYKIRFLCSYVLCQKNLTLDVSYGKWRLKLMFVVMRAEYHGKSALETCIKRHYPKRKLFIVGNVA